MRNWLVGLIVLLCTPAFAQQQPPVIAFDSMPDPLKLPDISISVKLPASLSILTATSSSFRVVIPPVRHTLPQPRSFSNLMPMAITCVRSAIIFTLGRSPTW